MTAVADGQSQEVDIRHLRARILSVLPAATYQMDRFYQFADIDFSDRTATACVEVGPQPRLHLNPRFVRRHCARDERLLMLVLHELYHVILGHTRLFPRLTEAHNVAFDAVINSMLCRQFPDPQYLAFFTRLNPATRFPGRLLRPPEGWPGPYTLAADASKKEALIIDLLYGEGANTVTYQDILDLFDGELPVPTCGDAGPSGAQPNAEPRNGQRIRHRNVGAGETRARFAKSNKGRYVLLGDHGGEHGSGEMDEAAVGSDLFKDVLRRITEDWPAGSVLKSRGDGGRPFDFLIPKPRSPRAEFVAALRRLLDKTGVLRPEPNSPYAWKRMAGAIETATVVPDWRDRHAHSRAALLDSPPLLYRSEVSLVRPRWRPRHTAHVYLDVSGSMSDELPWLAGALAPLERRGLCRLYAFSTIVAEVRRGRLLKDRIQNTFGTNISCVYTHFLGFPPPRTPRRVVILTDGFTGEPAKRQAAEAARRKVRLCIGLVGTSSATDLERHAFTVQRLPSLE